MKKRIKEKKKKNFSIVGIILSVISILVSVILVINIIRLNIVPAKYFTLFIILEILINLLIVFLVNRKKVVPLVIGIIFLIVLTGSNIVINNYVTTTNNFINKSFNKSYTNVSTDYILVTSIYNPINDISEVDKNHTIYYHKYSRSVDLAKTFVGNYNYQEIDSINETLDNLGANPDNYLLISKGSFYYLMDSSILFNVDNYKIIKEFTVSYKEETNNEVKTSYNIYLNGVDFTGIMRDFNMVITVNTEKKQILLTPLIRGFYMDVPAYGIKDTLMCLGSLDSSVSKEAIEEFLDTKIDYTVNINTNSLVNVVDTLGGIDFCSDYSFTTTHTLTTSTYNDGNGKKLYVQKGCKQYNGVEILTIARERLHLKNNERGRIDNCKKIMLSISKKTLSKTSLMNFDEVLNSYDGLYTTDMNKEVITSLFKSAIADYDSYEIIEQSIDGTDGTAMGHLGSAEVGVIFPDENQVKAASDKIKEVLNN